MSAAAAEPLPGLTNFMNDWRFAAGDADCRKTGGLKAERGEGNVRMPRDEETGRGSERVRPQSTGRLTQDWLDEAKRMVAAGTMSRRGSPARPVGSRRFAFADCPAKELTPPLERRDALLRTARRNRTTESISEEILQRSSARLNRSRSDFHNFTAESLSPAAGQQASHILDQIEAKTSPLRRLPPKLPSIPASRFLAKPHEVPLRRSFGSLSPSPLPPSSLPLENVPHQPPPPLSPPRNMLKSSHRRTVSFRTRCIDEEYSTPRRSVSISRKLAMEVERDEEVKKINAFLRRQRATLGMASDGEVSVKAKIVLSSYTPDTSSMVAAICYAWLLENTREREKGRTKDEVVVPVINMRRARMLEHKQAAWLFHHIGIDASALIFSDELDLEGLLMGKHLSLLIVGQDVLQTNGEVGSLCTILTDNYCEDAYDLLQTPNLKRLLLAGILLDTQNLSSVAKSATNRDAEAVQLLLVGSSPDYRDFFFEQVMKEHGEESFLESLRQHYGQHSIEVKQKPLTIPSAGHAAIQSAPALSLVPSTATEKSSRAKNRFNLGKLFTFSNNNN